jgi:hypothetical protein
MKTVEILPGREPSNPYYGPVVDLELNSAVTAVSVTVRTGAGEATVSLLETDWDHVQGAWQLMASMVVGQYDEKTLTAKVHPSSHELVKWSLSGWGGGPYWVNFTTEENE